MEKVDRVIVVYFGGKDSVVVFYLVKEVYKVLEFEVVMVDYGLMVEEVIENVWRMVEVFGVFFKIFCYDYLDIFREVLLKV